SKVNNLFCHVLLLLSYYEHQRKYLNFLFDYQSNYDNLFTQTSLGIFAEIPFKTSHAPTWLVF
ncbi:hypothetical protein, partial [Bacillus pacificus]|uniref:hypothetical protein n=1 Tax=Bacillus pacificus TaxID=2026187 RepID=UPI003D65D60A